jgi:YafQ family addiction module toxin component
MYEIEVREGLDRKFRKLAKRDSAQMEAVSKKIRDVAADPHAFKPLHFPLAGKRRVHIGSFVLVFSIDEARKTAVLEDYDHHDDVYKT